MADTRDMEAALIALFEGMAQNASYARYHPDREPPNDTEKDFIETLGEVEGATRYEGINSRVVLRLENGSAFCLTIQQYY